MYSTVFAHLMLFSNALHALTQQEKERYTHPSNIENKIREIKEHYLSYFAQPKLSILDSTIHLWLSGYPSPYINLVTHFSCAHNQPIDHAVKQARELDVPLAWFVFPESSPKDLAHKLLSRGFKLIVTLPAMVCFLDKMFDLNLVEDLSVKRLTEPHSISSWTHVMSDAFGHDTALAELYAKALTITGLNEPHVEHYAGYYHDELVATATLLINDDCAGIYNIATKSAFRHKGIATHMSTVLLKRAQELKLKYAVLIAAPHAENMYTTIGFKKVFDIDAYRLNRLTL